MVMAMCIRERRSRSEGSRSARIPDAKYYDAAAGYKYNHTSILGFSLTHLSGTGIPDLGDFLFIPGTGEMKLEPGSRENPDEAIVPDTRTTRNRLLRTIMPSACKTTA